MPVSELKTESDRLVESIVATVLQQAVERGLEFELAVFYSSVPHFFDREVVTGMLPSSGASTASTDEILQYLRSLPFCNPHPTRDATWIFEEDFRNNLIQRKDVAAHWPELQSRAANIFERRWSAKSLEGEERFKDPDSKSFAVEYIYHLQRLDPAKAASVVRHICAETLAIWTSTGGRPEVNFCLEFLGSVDWSPESEQAKEINSLKAGMKALSTYDDEKAL